MASSRALPSPPSHTKQKAIRIILAIVLIVGLAPATALCAPKIAQAASKVPIEYIPEESFTPEGYNWGIGFTDVEIVRGFTNEANIKQFYPRDYDELASPDDSGFAARIDSATPKGSFALRYTGASYQNDKVDAVVTLSDWNYVEPVMSNGESGWGEYEEGADYDTFQPGVFVNCDYQRTGSLIENLNFYTVGLTDLKVSVAFFHAGTDDPYEIKGHMTCIDLDVGQKFGFGGAVSLAQVVANNDFLSIDQEQSIVSSPDYACGGVGDEHGAISTDPSDPLYKLGLVGAYFDTTESNKGVPIELSFTSTWTGSHSTAQSFFAMTNEFLTVPNPSNDITEEGKLEVTKTADETDGVSLGDAVTYTVSAPVHERGVTCRNGYSYTDFEIVDALPHEMHYVEGSGYLADEEGKLIENAGEVVYEGPDDGGNPANTVKFKFSQSYLKDSMRMQGETYRFVFKAVLTEYPADGSLAVSNSAYAHVNNEGTYPSNDVETSLVPPKLQVEKSADAYEYEVGDVVHFSVSLTQSEKNAQCREVALSDDLPEGLKLIPETLRASGIEGIPAPSVEGNHWSYSLDKLNYGDRLNVAFDAIATLPGNGIKQTNIATASASNCADATGSAEIWENTASLAIEKTADRYEHSMGAPDQDSGAITYAIVVKNTEEGTIANNVIVSDESLPEGLKIKRTSEGDPMVDIAGAPESVAYPIGTADDAQGQTEQREVTCATESAGTGFKTLISHLPAGVPVTITYTCYPQTPIAGWEIENTATVSADNASPKRDSALVWLNQPKLKVEKTASPGSYSVGDLAAYRIKVTNDTPGTLGRNLVISDDLQTEGVELQQDSIKVWDSEGNDITDSCTIHTDRDKPSFTIETNRNLVNAASDRTFYRFGEQTEQGQNPLDEKGDTAIFVDYTVAIADDSLAGSTIENTATATTDEPNTQTGDKESITVKKAQLQVSKSADKTRYETGDAAHYSICVTQTQEGTTAHDIAIEDAFQNGELAEIDPSSIIVTGPDGSAVSNLNVTWNNDENGPARGFSLQTGVALRAGETMTVEYAATMCTASEHVVNRAQGAARDAAGSSAACDVEVIEAKPDASLEKTASTQTVRLNEDFTYTIRVHALSGTVRDVVISDESLPKGVEVDFNSFEAKVNGEVFDNPLVQRQGNAFSIALGTLEKGDTAEVSFTARITDESLVGSKVANSATLASSTLDGDRTAQAIIEVTAPAGETIPSASIEKSTSEESVVVGESIPYLISIEVGEADLENAILLDEGLPEGISIDYATLIVTIDDRQVEPVFESKDAQSFALKLGKVDAGMKISVEYEATAEDEALAGSTIENTATLASPTLPDSLRSSASVIAIEHPASKTDAELVKSIDRETVAIGERATFTIEATAIGNDVENVLISDMKMPSGAPIDFDSIQIAVDGKPIDAALESDGNTFSVFLGTLEKGSTATITFDADIVDEALAGTKFSNRATLISPSLEDARIAHAIVNVVENNGPTDGINGGTSKGKSLGKTGDELMSFALKMLPFLMASAAALGVGTFAYRKRVRRR